MTTLYCDICGKTTTGETQVGGSPFSGWFQVAEISGSSQIEELRRKKSWTLCGLTCLQAYAANPKQEPKAPPTPNLFPAA